MASSDSLGSGWELLDDEGTFQGDDESIHEPENSIEQADESDAKNSTEADAHVDKTLNHDASLEKSDPTTVKDREVQFAKNLYYKNINLPPDHFRIDVETENGPTKGSGSMSGFTAFVGQRQKHEPLHRQCCPLLMHPMTARDVTKSVLMSDVDCENNDRTERTIQLLQAIRDRREKHAIHLVRNGAYIDANDRHGYAITQAIRAGLLKLVRTLLEHGANANVKDGFGWAITQVIRAGQEALAIELVEQGARPDSKDSYGSAITQAQKYGYTRLEGSCFPGVPTAVWL